MIKQILTVLTCVAICAVTWWFIVGERNEEAKNRQQYFLKIDSVKQHYRERIMEDSITSSNTKRKSKPESKLKVRLRFGRKDMKAKRILLSLVLLITSWTLCYSQSTDSLQTYPVVKWRLWRLVKAYQDLPLCDSALNAYTKLLETSGRELVQAEKIIELRTEERDLKVTEAASWETLYYIGEADRKKAAKQAKKKAFKLVVLAVLEGVVIVLLL